MYVTDFYAFNDSCRAPNERSRVVGAFDGVFDEM